jgi:hypothetical protein
MEYWKGIPRPALLTTGMAKKTFRFASLTVSKVEVV